MRVSSFLTTSALALLFPLLANAMGIQVIINGQTVVFTDVPQSAWFATYVQTAVEAGIVNGYMDAQGKLTGKFGPGNSVTVAEALKIAVEGAGYDAELYGSVVDSGVGSHWASPYVSVAKAENFIVNASATRLNRPATRAEVAAIFTSAFDVDITVSQIGSRFDDVSASTTNAASIEALSRDEVVSGDTDVQGRPTGTFRPAGPINRAEVVKIVIGARARYGTPGEGKRPPEATGMTVHYTSAGGFSPSVLRVAQGTTVTFINDATSELWVASNPHPSHTDYPELNSNGSFGQGEVFVLKFSRLGSWGYHNHLSPSQGGTIVVE